jgi:transposase-like protein
VTTNLTEALADTFRRANWHETEGEVVCPFHFDAKDIHVVGRAVIHPELHRYHCACCRRPFSDIYGTPLERSRVPLIAWALLLLQPGYGQNQGWYFEIQRLIGLSSVDSLALIDKKLADSAFATLWKAEMEKTGISLERLLNTDSGMLS